MGLKLDLIFTERLQIRLCSEEVVSEINWSVLFALADRNFERAVEVKAPIIKSYVFTISWSLHNYFKYTFTLIFSVGQQQYLQYSCDMWMKTEFDGAAFFKPRSLSTHETKILLSLKFFLLGFLWLWYKLRGWSLPSWRAGLTSRPGSFLRTLLKQGPSPGQRSYPKAQIYLEYHSVCPLVGIGTPHPLSP